MRCLRTLCIASLSALVIVPALPAIAQSDAEIALKNARAAFAQDDYGRARDFAHQASQTDADNPDIFLLLGRAHFQLGDLDAALTAWRTVLRLAPGHEYATRMVAALQGRLGNAEDRLRLISSLIDGGLTKSALQELTALRNTALTPEQKVQYLQLQAESALLTGDFEAALKAMREVAVRDREAAATIDARLLFARARLARGGDAVVGALTSLRAIAAEDAESPAGIGAALELLGYRLSQGEDTVAELTAWIDANPEHRGAHRARRQLEHLVTAFLSMTRNTPTLNRDDGVTTHDQVALRAAIEILGRSADATTTTGVVTQFVEHVEKVYVAGKAWASARSILTQLAEAELPATASALLTAATDRIAVLEATDEFNTIVQQISDRTAETAALAAWIEAHSTHPKADEARRTLVAFLLSVSAGEAAATADSGLSAADKAALNAAESVIQRLSTAAEIDKVVKQVSAHLQTRYTAHGAHRAAITGLQQVLAIKLPPSARRLALDELLRVQIVAANAELAAAATNGSLTAGPLPDVLTAALRTITTINTDFPASPVWAQQTALAGQIATLSKSIAWPTIITTPKPTQQWAVELALPVIAANTDSKTTATATGLVGGIVDELAALTQPTARGLATKVHARLLAATNQKHPQWHSVVLRQVDLLAADALSEFRDNINTGRRQRNDEVSATQQQLLAQLVELVTQRPAAAAIAVSKLDAHLQHWTAGGHTAVVEQAYTALTETLPQPSRRTVRLGIARSRFASVLRTHTRLLSNGFRIPRALDPQAEQALQTCYELEGTIGPDDSLIAGIHELRQTIVNHYLALNDDATAEAAVRVRAEVAVPKLDEAAELQLASLKRRIAERELTRLISQHDGHRNISLTPEFNETIAAYTKFVTDHPASPRIGEAVAAVFAIGEWFEQQEAWLVAAEVYRDLETFSTGVESLNRTAPDTTSVPERAALAAAAVLHKRASKSLAEWRARQKEDVQPPDQASDEFREALTAWTHVVENYQDRPAARAGIARIADIALEYAALNAWDVADSMYAAVLEMQLPLSAPERFEFARAVCRLGQVMPEHARQVLTVLAHGEKKGADKDLGGALMAGLEARTKGFGPTTGGFGIAGGGGAAQPVPNPAGAAGAEAPVAETAAEAADGSVAAGRTRADMGNMFGDFARGGFSYEGAFRAEADAQLMAALRNRQSNQAQQVALLRDSAIRHLAPMQEEEKMQKAQRQSAEVAVLSDAELQRQQQILDATYTLLQNLRQKYPHTPTSDQAREQILVMLNHWRGMAQWERAARMGRQFLSDNPRDVQLPALRQEIARDYLAWAAQGVKGKLSRQETLDEIARRFTAAREELQAIIAAFPNEAAIRQQAQWDIANSYLAQARVVATSSPTLARGQYVRAATELLQVASQYHDHPQISAIPNMLWSIADELARRGYHDQAITVWNELTITWPTNALADQAAMRIAQTWHQNLKQPLRAVESYLELNFARGGNDATLQDTIYQIAVSLKDQKRWVEALHVLETYVDSFPDHQSAGQALTMIGQIHQANEVWDDAIIAYGRVIAEYDTGAWTTEAKWAIAECTINLSRWEEAIGAYSAFALSFPKDPRVAEAGRRVEVLKTLARYQQVVNEDGQRKAFDAQFQIGTIVRTQLSNPVKGIIEHRKVATRWPQSHLADDALFEIGKIYLELGETEAAREALLQAAERYPESPLADDALVLVGTSYVNEADKLAAVDRGKSISLANEMAQREAYRVSQDNRRRQMRRNLDQIVAARESGQDEEIGNKEAHLAAQALQFDAANATVFSNWAEQQAVALTAEQLADRQDRINAALRLAVASFRRAAQVTSANKADDALLQMASIYDERLKDAEAAMAAWQEIVRQYSGTAVAENASWKIAEYYEHHDEHQNAIAAYQAFLRNYRRSDKAGRAQAAIAENHEHLGEWVLAMDAYTNYLNNFPQGPLVQKARDQINWIKTYRL